MNDRIKLAEAMGWIAQVSHPDGVPIWVPNDSPHNYCEAHELPNPFTDANDDYTVRDFMANKPGRDHWIHFKNELASLGAAFSCNYQVGDYARAALKVIENE